MKKIVFLCLLVLSLDASDASDVDKHHIFIGATIGLTDVTKKIDEKKETSNSYKSFAWGLKAGYQYMPLGYVGLRTYLDYWMSIKPTGLDTIVSSLLSANIDFRIDVLHIDDNTFGFYGGVGLGFFQHANVVKITPEDKALVFGYSGLFNLGLVGTFDTNHSVEIGAKIPMSEIKSIANPKITYKDFYIGASYSYLF